MVILNRRYRSLNSRLLKNVSWLALLQFFNYGAPLIVLPLLARLLSVNEFGAFSSAMATTALALVITDYGFGLSATLRISQNREDKEYLQSIINKVISAKVLLLFLGSTFIFFVANLSEFQNYKMIFVIGIFSLAFQTFHCAWFYQGLERMKFYVLYMAITKILYVLLIIIVFYQFRSPLIAMSCWAFSNLIGMLISLRLIHKFGYVIRFCSARSLINELKYSSEFFYSRIALAIYSTACTVVLGANSLHQAALYSAAENALKAGQALTSAMAQALLPFMAKEKDWPQFRMMIMRGFFAIFCLATLAIYFSSELIHLGFGDEYGDATQVLEMMMLIFIINFLNVAFGYPVFSALGEVHVANKTMIFGCAIFCLLLAITVYLGVVSAVTMALLYLATELLITISRVVIFLQKIRFAR